MEYSVGKDAVLSISFYCLKLLNASVMFTDMLHYVIELKHVMSIQMGVICKETKYQIIERKLSRSKRNGIKGGKFVRR